MSLTKQQADALKEKHWPKKEDKAKRDAVKAAKTYNPDPTDPTRMRPRVPPIT